MASLKDIPLASTLRSAQQTNATAHNKEVADRNEQFAKRFGAACDKYHENLINEVKRVIETSKKTTKTSAILNDSNITGVIDGFSYATLLYGFWDRHTRKFDDSVFNKTNTDRPFYRAVTELAKLGYKLENISDSSKSFRLFIKLSW